MARSVTAYDFYDALGVANMAELLNSLHNSASPMYQRNVPEATLKNIQEVGAGILQFPATQNQFLEMLIEQVAIIVLKDSQLDNDLAMFKSGTLTYGRHIEEIFVDRLEATPFDLYRGEDEAFTIKKPDIKVIFHTRNRQEKYAVTISDEDLRTAFTSAGELESFVLRVLNQLISSNEADEYQYSLALMDNYHEKNLFTQVNIPDFDVTDRTTRRGRLEELVETVRATVTRMTIGAGTRAYNALAVQRRSRIEDLYLFLTPELDAAMDVNVLASAFNMDRTQFIAHKFVISDFTDPNLKAVLVDRQWFQIWDNLKTMRNNQNGANLTTKYFYHVWNTFSVSQLENAVSFVVATEDQQEGVYRIAFQAQAVDIRGGASYKAIPIVRAYNGVYDKAKIKYELVGKTSAQTTVSTDGTVTIGLDEAALMITLKATYDNGTEEAPAVVTGEMKIFPVKTLAQ